MHWNFTIKTAAPSIYKAENARINTDKVDIELAKKLFNYLKSSMHDPKLGKPQTSAPSYSGVASEIDNTKNANWKRLIPMYHGTNLAIVAKSADYKMFLAPENAKSKQREPHASSNQILFVSRNKAYAAGYSREVHGAARCTVSLRVPLYAIQEVRAAIFDPFVGHPYNYNESKHHIKLAQLIQPELKNIRAQLDTYKTNNTDIKIIRQKEKELFSKLANSIFNYVAISATSGSKDEYTVMHGIQKRFIDNITFNSFPQSGMKDVNSIKEKYKTDAKFRQEFHEYLKTNPYLWYILNEDELNQKLSNNPEDTVINLVKKSYQQWAQSSDSRISLVPEKFQHDTQILTYSDINGKPLKTSFHNWLKSTYTAPALKSLLEIKDYATLYDWMNDTSYVLQNSLVVQLREKIIEIMKPANPDDAQRMAQLLGTQKAFLFKNPAFVSAINEQVLSKVEPDELQKLMYWGDNDVSPYIAGLPHDSSKFCPALAHNPIVMKTYFQKVSPAEIIWDRFDPKLIKQMIPEIKVQILKYLDHGDIGALFGTKVPEFLASDDMIPPIRNKLLELANTDFTRFADQYGQMPEKFKADAELIAAIQNKLLTGGIEWQVWQRFDPSIYEDSKFDVVKHEARLMSGNILNISYDEMTTDGLKKLYLNKAASYIKSSPQNYKNFPDQIKLMPEFLEAFAKGVASYVKNGYMYTKYISPELAKSAEFAPYMPIINEAQLESNYSLLNYDELINDKMRLLYLKGMRSHAGNYPERVASELQKININSGDEQFTSQVAEIMKEIFVRLASGFGSIVINNEAFDDKQTIVPVKIPEHITSNPLWDKNAYYRKLMQYNRIRSFKASDVPPELKDTYKETLYEVITSYQCLSVLNNVDEPQLLKNESLIQAIKDAVYFKKRSGKPLPDSPTLDAIIEPYKKEINNNLLHDGYYKNLFTDVLSEEDKARVKKLMVNEVENGSSAWADLDDTMKSDKDILQAVLNNLKAKMNTYYVLEVRIPPGFQEAAEKAGLKDEFDVFVKQLSESFASKLPTDAKEGQYGHSTSWRIMTVAPKIIFNIEPFKSAILNKITSGSMYKASFNGSPDNFINSVKTILTPELVAEFQPAFDKFLSETNLQYYTNNPYALSTLKEETKEKLIPQIFEYQKKIITEMLQDPEKLVSVFNIMHNMSYSLTEYPDWKELCALVESKSIEQVDNLDFNKQENICYYINSYCHWSSKLLNVCSWTPERFNKKAQYYISHNDLSRAARTIKEGLKAHPKHELLKQTRKTILDKFIAKISEYPVGSYDRNSYCTICKRYFKTKKILELCDPNYKIPEPIATPAAPVVPAETPQQTEPPSPVAAPKPLTTVKLPSNSGNMNKMVNKFKDYYDTTKKET